MYSNGFLYIHDQGHCTVPAPGVPVTQPVRVALKFMAVAVKVRSIRCELPAAVVIDGLMVTVCSGKLAVVTFMVRAPG